MISRHAQTMHRERLFLACCFVVACSGFGRAQVDDELDEVIPKIIVASDYNDSLLAAGSAKYTVSVRDNIANTTRSESVLFWLAPNGDTRIDVNDGERNPRSLKRGSVCYKFSGSMLTAIARGDAPDDHSLFLYKSSKFREPVHIRYGGVGFHRGPNDEIITLADGLRGLQKSGASITANQTDEGSVELLVVNAGSTVEQRFELSPSEAYSVTRYSVKAPYRALPISESVTEYKVLRNGAFIAKKGIRTSRSWKNDELFSDLTTTFELEEVDLTPPDRARFELADYNIPAGVNLHDRIRMKSYSYGISPISREALELPTLYGSDKTRWWRWIGLATVIAIACLVFYGIQRRFRAR